MRNKSLVIAALLALVAVAPALAEEVIYFTNGTVMPIRGHEFDGDQIKVDLGDNGFMAFPRSVVEKIESAPGVELRPSTGSNRMVDSKYSNTRVYAASPRQSPGNPWAIPTNESTEVRRSVMQAPGGVPVTSAMPNHDHPGARRLQVIDRAAIRDTAGAAKRRAAGATRVSLPNPTIKQPKTKMPLTKKK
jgi:hypothetical protein